MPSTNESLNNYPRQVSLEGIYEGKSVIAFIIGKEVVDVFYADERFASILQSNPIMIELSSEDDPMLNGPHIGWKYDGENFLPPEHVDNHQNN